VPVIYRKNTDRLSIAECKRLILDVMPRGSVDQLHAKIDEDGNIVGEIVDKARTDVNLHALLIDGELPGLFRQKGIHARHRLAPSNTDYRALVDSDGRPVQDESYTINHDEFMRLAETYGCAVVVVETIQSPASMAPSESEPEPQDPERRLTRLRALGGTAKCRNGEWKFTGITELVAAEKSAGRKRCDAKTIRADLKEAAQAERDAQRAGLFQGLGG